MNTTTSNDTATLTPDQTPDQTTDPRPLFARAVATTAALIGDVSPDQRHLPTPCDAMDVERLRRHLLFVLWRTEQLGLDRDAFPVVDEPVLPDDVDAAWAEASEAAIAAWQDDRRLSAMVVLPWATLSGADTLSMYIAEVTTHTWDLAEALDVDVDWDDAVVRYALATMQAQLPLADRTPMWDEFVRQLPDGMPFDPPFANAVPVADDAPAIDRLVAWVGRRP